MNLGDEVAKRGINPHGKVATAAKQKILQSLTQAYDQMILKIDPHPGNILICKGSEASHQLYLFSNISFTVISSLDYGQLKDLPDQLRVAYVNLVLVIANGDPLRAAESYGY
ncbi:hypothetical protein JHK87_009966 [Glycine soja]|nr:hypothetical protein JHK87_009966 [Glycine soja]